MRINSLLTVLVTQVEELPLELFGSYLSLNFPQASGSVLALSYSSVRRRYSEFVWLDDTLKAEMPDT
jgi:hypothetical protein